MQSSDTSIRPGLAFPIGRERRRGNHAEERVKGTGEVRVRPGTGRWRRLGGRKRRGGARGRRGAVRAQPGAPAPAHAPSGQRGQGAVEEARARETWSPLTLL